MDGFLYSFLNRFHWTRYLHCCLQHCTMSVGRQNKLSINDNTGGPSPQVTTLLSTDVWGTKTFLWRQQCKSSSDKTDGFKEEQSIPSMSNWNDRPQTSPKQHLQMATKHTNTQNWHSYCNDSDQISISFSPIFTSQNSLQNRSILWRILEFGVWIQVFPRESAITDNVLLPLKK